MSNLSPVRTTYGEYVGIDFEENLQCTLPLNHEAPPSPVTRFIHFNGSLTRDWGAPHSSNFTTNPPTVLLEFLDFQDNKGGIDNQKPFASKTFKINGVRSTYNSHPSKIELPVQVYFVRSFLISDDKKLARKYSVAQPQRNLDLHLDVTLHRGGEYTGQFLTLEKSFEPPEATCTTKAAAFVESLINPPPPEKVFPLKDE